MMPHTFEHGEIIVLMDRREVRSMNGLFPNPPEMYVFVSGEYSTLRDKFEHVSWEAVRALAPDKYKQVTDEVKAIRDKREEGIAAGKPFVPTEDRIGQVFFRVSAARAEFERLTTILNERKPADETTPQALSAA